MSVLAYPSNNFALSSENFDIERERERYHHTIEELKADIKSLQQELDNVRQSKREDQQDGINNILDYLLKINDKSVSDQSIDEEQSISEDTLLDQLRSQEQFTKISFSQVEHKMKYDQTGAHIRQWKMTGRCANTIPFHISFDVSSSLIVSNLRIDISDEKIMTEIFDFIKRMESEGSLKPLFKGLVRYSSLASRREKTFAALRGSPLSRCIVSISKFSPFDSRFSVKSSQDDLEMDFIWIIKVNQDGNVESKHSIEAKPSGKYLEMDETHLLDKLPEKFLKLIEFKGIEQAYENIIKTLCM